MKYKRKQISEKERARIFDLLKEHLSREPLLFAYLFGSFTSDKEFNDIDIAVFADTDRFLKKSLLEYEIALEQRLANILREYSIDVRVLNNAPISFKYQVIKNGLPVCIRDEDAMTDFEVLIYAIYFDFAPFQKRYLKEVLSAEV